MIQNVNTRLIRKDGGTQAREQMSKDAVSEYAESMAAGVEFPPVVLFFDGVSYWLGDGFHRVAAAVASKRETISAEVYEGGYRDAVLHAVGANASHGLRRTNADKRRSVSRLLDDDEWAQWSNREIARRCGVSDPFVMALRQERSLTVRGEKPGKVLTVSTQDPVSESQTEIPEEERKAAIDAPKVLTDTSALAKGFEHPPKPDDRDARIAELTRLLAERDVEIEDLRERLADTGALLKTTQEDFERMERIMDAEDLLAAYQKEVKANVELARVVQSQNNGLMVENSDLKNRLKSALRKIERLTGKPPIPLEVA